MMRICERCGGAAIFRVWLHPVCGACAGEWFAATERLPVDADWDAFTRNWLAERRQEARP